MLQSPWENAPSILKSEKTPTRNQKNPVPVSVAGYTQPQPADLPAVWGHGRAPLQGSARPPQALESHEGVGGKRKETRCFMLNHDRAAVLQQDLQQGGAAQIRPVHAQDWSLLVGKAWPWLPEARAQGVQDRFILRAARGVQKDKTESPALPQPLNHSYLTFPSPSSCSRGHRRAHKAVCCCQLTHS